MTTSHSPEDLSFFFNPKSVAVFGASTKPNKSGYKLLKNIIDHQFPGKIFPINPRGGEILGMPLYTSLAEVPKEAGVIELAIIYVPNTRVVQILEDCIARGVKGAIIEAAGFGEVEEGKKIKAQIIEVTDNFRKIRVLGPNCTGITSIAQDGEGFFSSFIPMGKTKSGSLAIVSQSGFINGAYYPHFTEHNPEVGLRYVITIGNKLDLDENDVLEFLVHDPTVKVVAMYVESFHDVRRFIALSNIAQNKYGKKIILLRSGFSSTGSRATTSHTGALAERSELIRAVIKQSRVILAEDFWDLFLLAKTLTFLTETQINPITRSNIAICTISGAAGAIMSDWAEQWGITVPELDQPTWNRLAEIYPPWMPPAKFGLIDYWPAVEHAKGDYERIVLLSIEIALASPVVNAVFLTAYFNTTSWQVDWTRLQDLILKYKKPVFVWLFGGKQDVMAGETIFQSIKVPLFQSEKEIVRTFRKIAESDQGR